MTSIKEKIENFGFVGNDKIKIWESAMSGPLDFNERVDPGIFSLPTDESLSRCGCKEKPVFNHNPEGIFFIELQSDFMSIQDILAQISYAAYFAGIRQGAYSHIFYPSNYWEMLHMCSQYPSIIDQALSLSTGMSLITLGDFLADQFQPTKENVVQSVIGFCGDIDADDYQVEATDFSIRDDHHLFQRGDLIPISYRAFGK